MWFIFALLYSWFYCFSIEINKHYPFDGLLTVVWRSFFATMLMLCCLPFMYWPAEPTYYAVILFCALSGLWARQRLFKIVVSHNSRVASLQLPVAICITFIIWLAVDGAERQRMLVEPFYALGSIGAIVLVILSLFFIRKNDASWSAFKYVAPVGVLYAILGVASKLVLDVDASSLAISLNWVLLNNLFMLVLGIPAILLKHLRTGLVLRPQHIEKATFWGAGLHSIAWVFSALALIYTPNPAYPAVLGALIPVWFAIYYKLIKHDDQLSARAGFLLAAAAVLLLLVTV